MDSQTAAEPLIKALRVEGSLPRDDEERLRALSFRVQTYAGDETIVAEGSQPGESCLVINGFAARVHFMEDGARQISAIHIAGDFVDLHSLHLETMDHEVSALGACEVATVPHEELLRLLDESPQLMWLFWRLTVKDAAIGRAWISALGRLAADQHLAHLVCELYQRLSAVGIADDHRFTLPATQIDLADMLGLSSVHVNRTLKLLRERGLLDWQNRQVEILRPAAVAELAQFSDDYLRLSSGERRSAFRKQANR
ncbi:Crp/Fnr family transcriptional regulator [Pararhizobium haloflavum]|uniref:Crp/Fnr family transcriptional regulator n=1 Tax=Pararhizobium haloflavum TaxID=2037914 RepID=UPI0018E43E08|nr:Crp/Fnr family transcriptional regulator [Pararhizobium haloflavum]